MKGFQVHVKKVNRAPQQGTATETSQPLVEVWQRRRKPKSRWFCMFLCHPNILLVFFSFSSPAIRIQCLPKGGKDIVDSPPRRCICTTNIFNTNSFKPPGVQGTQIILTEKTVHKRGIWWKQKQQGITNATTAIMRPTSND